ncbi:TOG array regulator of axonemal microtubules protein 1 [Spea bombifrons]|uniref:TOG array regulator of axonemal microtubules protein 1 n=1 Tax=Spea bombifrons TaxID=233779 RepID=UPI00234AEC76|nr:TOG array regulator of axonemal microtubules protein 1 [Spea bombifrons]
MEVHLTAVASFASNGDHVTQIKNGSARRQSHSQDGSCGVPGEISTQSGILADRPRSYYRRSSASRTGYRQDNPQIAPANSDLRFGVIPKELHLRLLDPKDYKSRTQAIEELKLLIHDCNFSSVTHVDINGLISFLRTLLDDTNFTVMLVALDVFNCLLANLGHRAGEYVRPVISSMIKLLGDSKTAVKQEYMKIYMRLMKVAGPSKVLSILLENLKHRNSRVREEVVNVCIVSLLTHPSEDFNLPFLACEIAPCLIDGKRKVRHAALEAFAVLAASMGHGKSSLLKAVDEVELQENGEGLMNAVQARLARKTLPKINAQGLVEYALPFPTSAQTRKAHHLPGADTDWLLTGNRTHSGQSLSGDHSHRVILPQIDPVGRRMLSAGKGKNKFPWEETPSPGASDAFPGYQKSEKSSSMDDLHHTPAVRVPTAKTRDLPKNHSTNGFSANHDPVAADTGNENSTALIKAPQVRGSTARKDLSGSKPVPPIAKGATSLPNISNIPTGSVLNGTQGNGRTYREENIAIDFSDLNTKDEDDDDREEMASSLRHVRKSAAKKRAKMNGGSSDFDSPDSMKMELNLESPTNGTSPFSGTYSESGVYSRESMRSPPSPTPYIKKKFEEAAAAPRSTVRPTRLLSARNKDIHKKGDSATEAISTNYKPEGVVGQRMNYKSSAADAEEDNSKLISMAPAKSHPKDQQRSSKPLRGMAASTSNLQQLYTFDFDFSTQLIGDSVAVIGKGVFDTRVSACQTDSHSVFSTSGDQNKAKQTSEPPAGVYGRAVRHNGSASEIDAKVPMSKSARDKVRQSKNSLNELLHSSDLNSKETEILSRTDPLPMATGAPKAKSDVQDNLNNNIPHLRRNSSLKKTPTQRNPSTVRRSSVGSKLEAVNLSAPRELPNPNNSLTDVFTLLENDDWEKKIEGLALIRSLCAFHPDLVMEKLYDLSLAIAKEVKNLRSSVSRAAIACLGDMFTHLKKNMDHDLDNCVKVVLHKAGESSVFIREDVDKTLDAMVENVTPVRAMMSLINGGVSHLNPAVRKCTAHHLYNLMEKMGPGCVLSGVKNITDRALPAIAKFALDGAQETRHFGRKMLHLLMSHPEFTKMLEKYIPPKELPYVKDVIHNIKKSVPSPNTQGLKAYT